MPLIEASHDSLPYIDPDPDPTTRAQITALIASELPPTHTSTPHPSLPALPRTLTHPPSPPHQTPPIDTTRYELPPSPTPTTTPTTFHQTLTHASASSTHLSSRLTNLALLDRFGKNAWLIANAQLEDLLGDLEREVLEVRGKVEEVNRERRARQEGVRGEVGALEGAWRGGVGRVLRVGVAGEGVRGEVLERRRRGGGGGGGGG